MSTLDINEIRNYLLEVGCKVEYPILVNAFKKHLYNPDPNIQSLVRTQFKDYVNRLSTVNVENNMKFITLRPEFRPTAAGQPPPSPPQQNGHNSAATKQLPPKEQQKQLPPPPPPHLTSPTAASSLPPPMMTSSPKRQQPPPPPSEFVPPSRAMNVPPAQQAPPVPSSPHRRPLTQPPPLPPQTMMAHLQAQARNDRLDSPLTPHMHQNNNFPTSPIQPVQQQQQQLRLAAQQQKPQPIVHQDQNSNQNHRQVQQNQQAQLYQQNAQHQSPAQMQQPPPPAPPQTNAPRPPPVPLHHHSVSDVAANSSKMMMPPPRPPPRRRQSTASLYKPSSNKSIDKTGRDMHDLVQKSVTGRTREHAFRFNSSASTNDLSFSMPKRNSSMKENRLSRDSSTSSSFHRSNFHMTNRSRSSHREDESDSSSLQPNDPLRRRWTIEACSCNYNNLMLMLREDPKLASCKDIMNGYTALHWAAKFGNLDIIRLVAGTYGVSVNVKSSAGQTPLHIGYMFNQRDVIEMLLQKYQASTEIRDHSGKKPEQYARAKT